MKLALLAAAATGCYTSAPDDCLGETWGRYEWTMDGVSGSSGCFPTLAFGSTDAAFGPGRPAMEVSFGGPGGLADPRYMPTPFCLAGIAAVNIELGSGATGSVSASDDTDGRSAALFVRVDTSRASSPERCVSVADGIAVPTGGEWSVLRGATWGEIVDFEVNNVTFEPVDGHQLVLVHGRWLARLPSEPTRYP